MPCVFAFAVELVLAVLALVSVTVCKILLSDTIFITTEKTSFVHLDLLLIFLVVNVQKTLPVFLVHLPVPSILNYMIVRKFDLNSKFLFIIVLPITKVVDKLMMVVLCG